MKTKNKTIKRSELSNIKMTSGNEKRINKVILNGFVNNWVGIGWIEEGKANKEDYLKYPVVID